MTPRHDFGIILGDVPVEVDARAHLDGVLRQVDAAQRSGFTQICLGQHFLYESYRWLQPIPLLGRLAAELDPHVRIAVAVLVLPFYHPVVLAEEIATLDIVSGGRLDVGIGAGYAAREFELMGVPYRERFRRMQEGLRLIKAVWSDEVVDFHGEFWQVEGGTPHVRPLQQPRPPLWMGAMKERGIRRAAREADSWAITPETSFADAEAGMAVFDAERDAHGLPPARFPMRREIVIGTGQDDAVERYRARSQERYVAYANRGHGILQGQGVQSGFREWALERAVLGTPDQCVERLTALDPSRLGPIIVRPGWPGMGFDDVVANIEELGEQIVRPLHTREARG